MTASAPSCRITHLQLRAYTYVRFPLLLPYYQRNPCYPVVHYDQPIQSRAPGPPKHLPP
jgi:hypothetical protein